MTTGPSGGGGTPLESLFVELVARVDDVAGKIDAQMAKAEKAAAAGEKRVNDRLTAMTKQMDAAWQASARSAEQQATAISSSSQRAADSMHRTATAGSALERSFAGAAMAGQMLLLPLGLVATALGGIGVKAVMMASSLEQSQTAFGQLLGGADKANKFLDDLFKFASKTPFEFTQLQGAARTFMAFGAEADKVIPIMTALGDAVAGVGGGQFEIQRVTRALTQMLSLGRVSAEEMNQLAEVIPGPWQILADQLGITMSEARDKAEKGLIGGAQAVNLMLKGMGEKFSGQMEAQSTTLNGLFSTFKDNANGILASLGKTISDTFDIKGNLAKFLDVMSYLNELLRKKGLVGALQELFPPETHKTITAIAGAITGALLPAIVSMVMGLAGMIAPLIPFIAIGALIAVAAREIIKDWDGVKRLFTQVTTVLGTFAENATKFFSDVKRRVEEMWNGISSALDNIKKGIDSATAKPGAVEDFLKALNDITKWFDDNVGSMFRSVGDDVEKFGKDADVATPLIYGLAAALVALGSAAVLTALANLVTAIGGVATAVGGATAAIAASPLGPIVLAAATAGVTYGALQKAAPGLAPGGIPKTAKLPGVDYVPPSRFAPGGTRFPEPGGAPLPKASLDRDQIDLNDEAVQSFNELGASIGQVIEKKPEPGSFFHDDNNPAKKASGAAKQAKSAFEELGLSIEKIRQIMEILGYSADDVVAVLVSLGVNAYDAEMAFDALGIQAEKLEKFLRVLGFSGGELAAAMDKVATTLAEKKAFEEAKKGAQELKQAQEEAAQKAEEHRQKLEGLANTLTGQLKPAFELIMKLMGQAGPLRDAAVANAMAIANRLGEVGPGGLGKITRESMFGADPTAPFQPPNPLLGQNADYGGGGGSNNGSAGSGISLPSPSGQDNGFWGKITGAYRTMVGNVAGIAAPAMKGASGAASAFSTGVGGLVALAESGGDVAAGLNLIKEAWATLGKSFGESLSGPALQKAGAIQDYIKNLLDAAAEANGDPKKLGAISKLLDGVTDSLKELVAQSDEMTKLIDQFKELGETFSYVDMSGGPEAMARRLESLKRDAQNRIEEAKAQADTWIRQQFATGAGGFSEGELSSYWDAQTQQWEMRYGTSQERFESWQRIRFGKTYAEMEREAYVAGQAEAAALRDGLRDAAERERRNKEQAAMSARYTALASAAGLLGVDLSGIRMQTVSNWNGTGMIGAFSQDMIASALAAFGGRAEALAGGNDYQRVLASLAAAIMNGDIAVNLDGFAVGRLLNKQTMDSGVTAGQFGLR